MGIPIFLMDSPLEVISSRYAVHDATHLEDIRGEEVKV